MSDEQPPLEPLDLLREAMAEWPEIDETNHVRIDLDDGTTEIMHGEDGGILYAPTRLMLDPDEERP